MKAIKRLLSALSFVLVVMAFMSLPVHAIANPDSIDFGSGSADKYAVFYDVIETGDWLIMAEGLVDYTIPPTDYTASEAFIFELLNTTGTSVYISTPIVAYGDRPVAIYQTAAQITALGLTVNTAYGIRIRGNPLIFASPTGNSTISYLAASDYLDQNLGDVVDELNPLRIFCLTMAQTIEAFDTPVDPYVTKVQGKDYLTVDGGDIFLASVPLLSTFVPSLFQASGEQLQGDIPDSYGAYQQALSPANKMGTTAANGLTNIGIYFGISQSIAGVAMLFLLGVALAIAVYLKTESGAAVVLIASSMPSLGAFLGFMPIAIGFILTMVVAALTGYLFMSRGAL